MTVLEQKKVNINKHQLASLYDRMLHHEDVTNANKILDLFEKLSNNHFHVSFTGHFSAGKSSIINYMLGKELLPKSPIPTSANIVKITSGAGIARVFFNEQNPIEYDEPYDIDMIKDYCMTKDTINQIEIHTSEKIVPNNTFIVDTPGIDAADDADRYMTESSLHLVDVLFYVMDYNHVQSEINFTFLKQIQDKNIPIYIIINQVDKHNDQELSFEEFSSSVEESFKQWSIHPERIYYSSVMDQQLPYNELTDIKDDLFDMLEHYESVAPQVTYATEQVVESHRHLLNKQFEQATASLTEDSFNETKWEEITQKLKSLDQRGADFESEFTQELNQTLNNAYLMPANLRDLAHQFLESQDSSFKVGFFGRRKKTAEAKESRLKAFYTELEKTIESTIIWRLREKFAQLLQDYQIATEELRHVTQNFSIPFSKKMLFDSLKEGATVNGNYVLNYTNEVSNEIKQQCRQRANDLFTKMNKELKNRIREERSPYLKEKAKLQSIHQSSLERSTLEQSLQEKLTELKKVFKNSEPNDNLLAELETTLTNRYVFIKKEMHEIEVELKEVEETTIKSDSIDYEKEKEVALDAEEILAYIDETITHIRHLPDFDSLVADLKSKKSRIENRSLTIALFGAFSAGKSSFSNALLGERMLPVSPNPTTAVINRIRPTTESYSNGTIVISYKSDEVLTDDLATITKDFSPKATNFNDLIAWIKQEKLYEKEELSHVYQSYLKAILEGYDVRKNLLGKKEEIDLDDFAAYVTDESIAAYIEAVDLYTDNKLTENGITLVDTPGANSVNARHTNVAFDYIKDADAIIYVTYYNHAVTSADRDFLMQLGRVKESFELDKMFFIVNAADLAENETELNMVVEYVGDQLLQYGIRQPQIYPLSSKLSLEEKEAHKPLNEQMLVFEETFHQFIEHDLHVLTYEAAIWDMQRVQSRLENIIQSSKLDEQDKEKTIQALEEKLTKAKNLLADKVDSNVIDRMEERIERQLHFVKERLYIRFHTMFQEYFNPTTVTENGRQVQRQLQSNRNRLIDYVGYELLQEVRAVSLRIEAFMNELLKDHYEQISAELKSIDETIIIANFEEKQLTTPNYLQAFESIDMNLFQDALRTFRNLRAFFEQNERETMRDKLYDALKPEADAYLDTQKTLMTESYQQQLVAIFAQMIERIQEEVETVITQQINVLQTDVDYTTYAKTLDEMTLLIDNLKSKIKS